MIYPNTDKEGTTWSRVIPLAAAGSAGIFKLKQGDRSYEVIVLMWLPDDVMFSHPCPSLVLRCRYQGLDCP